MNQKVIGSVQVVASGACFGLLGLFGKSAFERGFTPGELLSLRFSIAALMMFFGYLLFEHTLLKLPRKYILYSLALGILGYALFSSCYFMALQGVSASLTVLLLYTYPLFVALFSILFFKEKITRTGWSALGLSLLGLIGLVWGEWSASSPVYLVYGFCSAVFYALYVIISGKILKGANPLSTSFYMQLGAGLSLALLHFKNFERPFMLLQNNYIFIGLMSFVCSILAMTLFLLGLQKMKASDASLLSMTEPFFGVVIATLFLGESLLPVQLLGGVLVCLGLWLTGKEQSQS